MQKARRTASASAHPRLFAPAAMRTSHLGSQLRGTKRATVTNRRADAAVPATASRTHRSCGGDAKSSARLTHHHPTSPPDCGNCAGTPVQDRSWTGKRISLGAVRGERQSTLRAGVYISTLRASAILSNHDSDEKLRRCGNDRRRVTTRGRAARRQDRAAVGRTAAKAAADGAEAPRARPRRALTTRVPAGAPTASARV